MKKWIALTIIAFCLTLGGVGAATADGELLPPWLETLRCVVPGGEQASGEVMLQADKEGAAALFLPSCAELNALTFLFDGESLTFSNSEGDALAVGSGQPADFSSLFPAGSQSDGRYPLTVSRAEQEPFAFYFMISANQATIWVVSDDPVNQGRAYVDSAPSSTKYSLSGSLLMLDANGRVIYDNGLRELRSRGNTTWDWAVKKPYQIKLEQKADLLENERDNTARTWLLMAEAFDATGLHNTVSLGLGKALGLEGTPEARMVDFYFDGEYRGYYLLCEKVQVDQARLNMLNYSDYLEEMNPGIEDREAFPLAKEKNSYGNEYQYVENVRTDLGAQAAYLVELDQYKYELEDSWFSVKSADALYYYTLKTPEYAPSEDVAYVSERMQGLVDAVYGGGVNPNTGKPLSEYLDYDSMARLLLINEVAKTCDFAYTSTFFYLPLGSGQFRAGPLWDFDIAYGIRDNRPYEAGTENYVPYEGWIRQLMTVPDFQLRMKELYTQEVEPLIREVLLGQQKRLELCSIDDYVAQRNASRLMNERLWEYGGGYNNMNWDTLYPTYEENLAFFREYLTARLAWMNADMALWSGSEISDIGLKLSYINAKVADTTNVTMTNVFPHYTISQIAYDEEPIEETPWRHAYTARITLEAKAGCSFAQTVTAAVNGFAADVTDRSETSVTVNFRFSAPFYEEALYDDVDYGLLFQYDYYVAQYPELLEELDGDRDAILENYVYYDMGSEVSAIETFDYALYYECYQRILDAYFMGDVNACTLFYMDNDQDSPMMGLGEAIYPEGF
ncbi:MAG: CotH kinase family protein [Eubacteriales bacterium]|nr:CotH kinase family protein [Eubacteriales bacterium]